MGTAQVWTVISWCTYPVVYLFPMLGINAAHAVVGIQIGTASPTSSPSAVWDWLSIRSLMQSQTREASCQLELFEVTFCSSGSSSLELDPVLIVSFCSNIVGGCHCGVVHPLS